MTQIPDAPWIRDPEPYRNDYYGGCYEEDEDDERDD